MPAVRWRRWRGVQRLRGGGRPCVRDQRPRLAPPGDVVIAVSGFGEPGSPPHPPERHRRRTREHEPQPLPVLIPGLLIRQPEWDAIERAITEFADAVSRMEARNPPHPKAGEARRALDAIMKAREGRMPEGVAGPAETRLRPRDFLPQGPNGATPNAVTTEERRDGTRVEGGDGVIEGNETVTIEGKRLKPDPPGYPAGYNDGANGGILAHEGVRLRQKYSRDTQNPTKAEKCESLRNTKEALELHKAVLEEIAGSKSGTLETLLFKRAEFIANAIAQIEAEMNRLGC